MGQERFLALKGPAGNRRERDRHPRSALFGRIYARHRPPFGVGLRRSWARTTGDGDGTTGVVTCQSERASGTGPRKDLVAVATMNG